jgi:hypothetical protein
VIVSFFSPSCLLFLYQMSRPCFTSSCLVPTPRHTPIYPHSFLTFLSLVCLHLHFMESKAAVVWIDTTCYATSFTLIFTVALHS